MHDEPHTHSLAAIGRQEEAEREAAWGPVLLGQRDPAEVAAEREAAGDSAMEIAAARAVYSPLSEDARERLLGQLDPPTSDGRRWAWVGAAVASAAAIALTIWSIGSRREREAASVAAAPALPSYALTTDSGLATARGDDPTPTPLRYRAGNQIDWLLRPEEDVQADVLVLGCARADASGERRPLPLAELAEISATGSIRLHGPIAALGLEPGVWTVTLTVAPATAPPDPCADAPESGVRPRPVTLTLEP